MPRPATLLPTLLLAAPLLAPGCANPAPVAALAVADGASIAVFGRGLADLGVSAITGRDCSVVRLDKGQTYCADTDPPPTERLCTRTLATPDCWPDPIAANALPPSPQGLGDTPPPSPAQERYRAARWPKSLFFQ